MAPSPLSDPPAAAAAVDPIPYGRQSIGPEDRDAVAQAVGQALLTTGPTVQAFEDAFTGFLAPGRDDLHGVACATGTAALHLMMAALDLGPGDQVIVPALTFAATANAALYVGAEPVFADVDARTLLIDPTSAARLIGPRTKALVGVDYAGQPCDWDALAALADAHKLHLLADGCHAPGAAHRGRPVGTLAKATSFSFHPVKHITTGEGGMVTTTDAALAERLRHLRHHAMARHDADNPFRYDVTALGFNYRLSDINCALGLAQVARLPQWLDQRRALAARYDAALAGIEGVSPLARRDDTSHAYHLYVIRTDGALAAKRDALAAALRARGIGTAVHYPPLTQTTFYRERLGTRRGDCPAADRAYETILSIPLYPGLTDAQADRVVAAIAEAAAALS
ncbi:dTDP-4-amino-4,6-dideoxygalactose transaminase [Rhodothalassium salexigens DSM 2132]|uniref:dTDP-4-amino-4,6-dideoxygalactose transaminase n=1 Tax=Rhodothalassium salexigens DSM 2132 TaxID=1188247 RepID=A0A4R2PWG0_RHOSA|nr:DegT/DnrJ/EryC1/StrS family aminotransferase [Rhodothalassium salexigens]MBB4210327.1 perosamine synthetase [Rhodothalassium salexigens DSM 2132]TCP38491.1 dTDP-4-amino-4,6-dideoxygalactose transaminase [Rhodothalassium salexigens DSM 2132]